MGKLIRSISVIVLIFFASLPLSASQAVSLTILHTNDTHGHLKPFSYPDAAVGGPELQGLRTYRNIGGIARRATLVKQIRKELEPRGTAVWLVDIGDFADGTPFSIEYHGEADVSAMNAVGYDLGTLGNHEFNNSIEQLKKLIALSKFKLLCANAVVKATGATLVDPMVIRNVGDLRIGVFGLLTHESATYKAGKEGIAVENEMATAKRMVDELHRKADVVILLSHAGKELDEQIGAEVPGIDVIIGGHSHSRLPAGELIWRSDDLKMAEVNGTVIVQGHQWGGELGRLDLLFAKDETGAWHVDRYRSRLLPITSDIPEDEAVAAVVSRFWDPIAPRYGEVIGKAAGEFSSRGDDLAEYNLVADAVRETTGAEFEMENLAGVRAPLLKGDITLGDLVTMDPFDNTVVKFKAAGRDIIRILKRYAPPVSGIRYRILNGELIEATIGGKPIDEDRVYSGASNSYFAGVALKGLSVEDTGKVRLKVIIDYIRQKGIVAPSFDSRRVVINR